MRKLLIEKSNLHTGIQYMGIQGSSDDCQSAVVNLLQSRAPIQIVRILSCSGSHSLLLTNSTGDLIAIKSGFGSGYVGQGSRTFSFILQLFEAHGIEIDEYDVDKRFLNRLDFNALTNSDLERLDNARPVRPIRWPQYVFELHWDRRQKGTLWQDLHPIIPYALIDPRITDLAISFWDCPDERLLTGYRRLEDIVRKRANIDEHGAKLFSQAFQKSPPKLYWDGLDSAEQNGRGQLFNAVYSAYRNPRAHRELGDDTVGQLAEFLVLNQLYRLESEARLNATGNEQSQSGA